MNPLLVTTAASAAGDIIHTIADRISSATAKTAPAATPSVPFVNLIDKASAPTAASKALHTQDLGTRLGQSAEVAAAANAAGASGPLSIQIDANGDSALRLPNGDLKPIQLSEEMRGVARELHQMRQPAATSATPAHPASPVTISIA
jgi:hypothetical protein